MPRTFDEQSSRRIARSVLWTERQRKFDPAEPPRPQPFPAGVPLVGFTDGNIDHDDFGTVDVATGTDFDTSVTAHANREYTNVYNPGPHVKDGERVLIQPCRMAGSSRIRWNIVHGQSVALIGKTDAQVTAGSTGTVSIWDNSSDTTWNITGVKLDWMHNSENISANKEVVIMWFPYEQVWRFIGAECE